jgi:hypothetical protein
VLPFWAILKKMSVSGGKKSRNALIFLQKKQSGADYNNTASERT